MGFGSRLADDGKRCQAQGVAYRVPEAAELDDLSYSKRGGSPRGERVVPDRVPLKAGGFFLASSAPSEQGANSSESAVQLKYRKQLLCGSMFSRWNIAILIAGKGYRSSPVRF